MKFLLPALAGLLLLGACSLDINYRKAEPTISPASGKTTLAVSAVDVRPQLLSNDIPSKFVGNIRDSWGIPYRMNTSDGRPLVAQLTDAIVSGYQKAGYSAVAVTNPSVTSRASAIAALQQTGRSRFLLLTVHELYNNTLVRTEVTYDLTLEAIDHSGRVLTSQHAQATEKVLEQSAAIVTPIAHAQKCLSKEIGSALTSMTQAPNIRAALR